MLLAVNGGGLFSSSASGYTKGLMLLLLGRGKDERPMRIAPCSNYQLVEQKRQLATNMRRPSRGGCAFLVCFRRTPARADEPPPRPPPPVVGPVDHSGNLPDLPSASDQDKVGGPGHCVDENNWKAYVKSSLKKPSTKCSKVPDDGDRAPAHTELANIRVVSRAERRKVQWRDSYGGELANVREFEISDEDPTEDESGHSKHRCQCVIQ